MSYDHSTKIARFDVLDSTQGSLYGRLEGEDLVEIAHWLAPQQETGRVYPLQDVRLLAPVTPGKVMAIGMNYREHIREMGHDFPQEPLMFLKSSSSVCGPRDAIELPGFGGRVEYEGELAIIIGKTCKHVPEAEALSVVAGYTCANDVTARELQRKDGQWSRAKSFDTFCPLGPWILMAEEGINPQALGIQTRLNGKTVQKSNTDEMVFSLPRLIAFVSQVMTLHPGDVLLTGTPSGIGPMTAGDEVSVEIEGIGVLTNPVRAAASVF